MGDFKFPPIYSAPPFFTIQPVQTSQKTQMDSWCDLICSYCKEKRKYEVDVVEDAKCELFYNKTIERRLKPEDILVVLDELCARGNGKWDDRKDKKRCRIIWRTRAQWADIIYKWVVDSGLTDTVQTVFSLHEGEESEGTEFHQLEHSVLMSALRCLEEQDKAEIFEGSNPGNEGVKFFAV